MIASKKSIELLAPAKNLEAGLTAISSGADAVYIGGPNWGARKAASNSLEDIRKLIEFAHFYKAKVYITLNTILFDNELDSVQRMIKSLVEIDADAIIIQDPAILKMQLFGLPVIASTQMNNTQTEHIQFLENIGFKRVILARELSIQEIKTISNSVKKIELEYFVHGALCVSYSGRCYMSFASSGRSANRGECAQICRHSWTMTDENSNVLIKDKHLLSLKDLNLTDEIKELLDAGITSFKIEGRLKDKNYVKAVVSHYRKTIDSIIENNPAYTRTSSGIVANQIEIDPANVFNRGFSTYFLRGRKRNIADFDTPKSKGEKVGYVESCSSESFKLSADAVGLRNGDGICYIGSDGVFRGCFVNRTDGDKIIPASMEGIVSGTEIFRNFSGENFKLMDNWKPQRKISIQVILIIRNDFFEVTVEDEDGIKSALKKKIENPIIADKIEFHNQSILKQFGKTGNTNFIIHKIDILNESGCFFKMSFINNLRRDVLIQHSAERIFRYTVERMVLNKTELVLYKKEIDYKYNISNRLTEAFYKECGVEKFEKAIELTHDFQEKELMVTKYCLLFEMGFCKGKSKMENKEYFITDNKRKYKLEFDCKNCVMKIFQSNRII